MRWSWTLLFLAAGSLAVPTLPAVTFLVTNTNDSGAGSLRQAVLDANANPGGDSISFSNITGTITLNSVLPTLADVSILGPGAHRLTVEGFRADVAGVSAISGLTLKPLDTFVIRDGGIISNTATLCIAECEITGALYLISHGAAIYNSGRLVISGSSIYGNRGDRGCGGINPPFPCFGSFGGALYNAGGEATITNTTFSDNAAVPGSGPFDGRGGAIYVQAGNVVVVNCTFVDNWAAEGKTIYGSAELINCIVIDSSLGSPSVAGNNLFASSGASAGVCPLQDNGGPTLTHGLSNSSPAIEAGTLAGAPLVDQRGISRPQGPAVDIGAVEFVWPPNSFALLTQVNGPGTVIREPNQIVFPSNAAVTLTALGNEDYDLTTWSGDGRGSQNPFAVVMNTNKTIAASFAYAPATVTNAPGTTNFVTNINPWGPGSLRQAIRNINASGGGSIRCSNAVGTISLGSELPPLTFNTSIRGPGKDVLAIVPPPGAGTFVVQSGSTSSISGLTIQYSHPTNHDGGAIFNAGRLTLNQVNVLYCSGATNGGAIFNSGSLSILDSTLKYNNAPGSGGAIYSCGDLMAAYCDIAANSASPRFSASYFLAGGGGVYSKNGTGSLSNCRIVGNRVYGPTDSLAAISLFAGLSGLGGGLMLAGGQMSVISSTVASNTASGGGGGASPDGKIAGSGGSGLGGGIEVEAGVLLLTNCTISHNLAIGGQAPQGRGTSYFGSSGGGGFGGGLAIGNAATGFLASCTFSMNQAIGGIGYSVIQVGGLNYVIEVGQDAFGGGLSFFGDGFLLNCTVAANQAVGGMGKDRSGSGVASGLYSDGRSFSSSNQAVLLQNTILSDDLAGSTITSLGHNLFAPGASGATNTDLQGVDPKLGPLQDNGGPTWTHALLAGSPAIDAGVSGGLAFDQRGQPRTIDIPAIPNAFGGDGTDVGALEVDPVLRLTEAGLSGTNVLLKFTTVSDKAYAIQSRPGAVGGVWTPLPGLAAGTGGIVAMTNDLPPSVAARYYRAVAQPP